MRRLLEHWPLLTVAVVLLWLFPFIEPIHPPNELSRLYQARAIVEDGTLAVDGMIARHGRVHDLSVFEGRHYPNKAPGVSLLGAGVYQVYRTASGRAPEQISLRESLWVLEKALMALPTLLLLVAMRRFLLRHFADDRWAVDVAVMAWALGSCALPYSLLLFSHQLAAVFLFGSLMAYTRCADQRGELWIGVGAFLSGLALLVEYTVAPAVGVLAIYAVVTGAPSGIGPWTRRVLARTGLGVLGAAVPVAVLLWYHDQAFGSPFATGYSHLATADLSAIHAKGVLGLQAPRLKWLIFSLFSGQGLLALSPWLALSAGGLWLCLRRPSRRPLVLVTLAVSGCYLLFASSWDTSTSGWSVGPRHLVGWVPFLIGPTATALCWLRDRPGALGPRLAGAACGLCVSSMLLFGVVCVTYAHFPPEYENGPFQLSLPLLRSGYVVHNLGSFLLGTSRVWTLVPVALALVGTIVGLGLLWPGRASIRGRLESLGACLAVAAAVLGLSALRGRPASQIDARHWEFITGHYDPRPGADPGALFGSRVE